MENKRATWNIEAAMSRIKNRALTDITVGFKQAADWAKMLDRMEFRAATKRLIEKQGHSTVCFQDIFAEMCIADRKEAND